ncbi:hypothetical protein FQR65_LT16259 [Abscondita terminalis]|nr:hypothetical protein FQR65_LT16259 [Abscondita terminalis]
MYLTSSPPFRQVSIERIAEVSGGRAWFQLYHPTENRLRDNIIKRLQDIECPVLVVLIDVPSFGLRYREIKSGLSMPPKKNISNIFQASIRPVWEDMQSLDEHGVGRRVIVVESWGRQVDAGESSIASLRRLAKDPEFTNKITIMMDGGLRSVGYLASAWQAVTAAEFAFDGEAIYVCWLGALGTKGGRS